MDSTRILKVLNTEQTPKMNRNVKYLRQKAYSETVCFEVKSCTEARFVVSIVGSQSRRTFYCVNED